MLTRNHPTTSGACLLACAIALSGCGRETEPQSTAPIVAVANSYLEAAVAQFLPSATLVRLAEPGTCPGHFDLRPQQLRDLRGARALLRFDFQRGLDDRVRAAAGPEMTIAIVAIDGGMCEPESFAAACRQVGEQMEEAGLLAPGAAAARFAQVEQRLNALGTWAREEVRRAGLHAAPVATSYHQEAFCTFLGLGIAGRFRGADTARIDELHALLKRGSAARVVIANRPEGVRLAESLAGRLSVPLVVFDNFPDGAAGDVDAFERLVRANVSRLVEAAGVDPR